MSRRVSVLTFDIGNDQWLTSNRHITNRPHRARIIRDLHGIAAGVALADRLKPVAAPVECIWTVHYPKGVRTDKGEASNAQPTTKALLDGLVPRWLPDDGPAWVTRETFERGANLPHRGVHTVVLTLRTADPT